jgi:hypothetical protein
MNPVTSRRVNAIKGVTQELPKASEGKVCPHLMSHLSEPNLVSSVKLQGGKELPDQPWTIVLLDDHNLVQPHLLSDPQSVSKILILGQEFNVHILHGHTLVSMGA